MTMQISGRHIFGYTEPKSTNEKTFKGKYLSADSLPYSFPVAGTEEADKAAKLAQKAFHAFRQTSVESRVAFLNAIAENILALGDDLLQLTATETALPIPRLTGERGRTVNQIKMFVQLITEGSWVNAIIETADPARSPLPKPDTRQMQVPLGPVAVFGASNFPYAFSVAGGDTIAAFAAGCPVVFKAHSAHPATSEAVGLCIRDAARSTGMPEGVFSMLHGNAHSAGQSLAAHPDIKAVAFTGSFFGGKSLYDIAVKRPDPIPVYAEMGSVNPVFILPGIQKQAKSVAEKLAASNLLGVGQFCTNPGIIIIQRSSETDQFIEAYSSVINAATEQCMLYPGIADAYQSSVSEFVSQSGLSKIGGAQGDKSGFATPVVFSTTASLFAENKSWHEEVFGPFSLLVIAENEAEVQAASESFRGQLTVTLWGNEEDEEQLRQLSNVLADRTGRIIINGVPTGVEVGHAMVHGGPFPSTTDSRATSVGSQSIYRFTRPVCFQDFPDTLLPAALKNENQFQIWRKVNGEMTKNSI